jgi:hypothetical protein
LAAIKEMAEMPLGKELQPKSLLSNYLTRILAENA